MTNALTDLQFKLIDALLHSEYAPSNGSTPESYAEHAPVWFWPDELAPMLGITGKALGGVVTSCTEAGLVRLSLVSAADKRRGDDDCATVTESGFAAWQARRAA